MVVAREQLDKTRSVDDLGIEALKRQEHDAKIRGLGHRKVFFADVFGLRLNAGIQDATRRRHGIGVTCIYGLAQMLVSIAWKLRIDRQQDGVARLHRQLDGKLDTLG